MRHEEGDVLWAWGQKQRELVRPTQDEARLARFDATQDLILAAAPFSDRTLPGAPLTLAEHDVAAERLADACRRYLTAHAVVKAGGR